MSKPITEKQIFDIITATFKHREQKIAENAARYARDMISEELMRRDMAVRLRRPRQIKADFTLANQSLRVT